VPAEGEEVTPEELGSFVGDRLARYKIPKDFRVVDELPRTPYGKVVKGELVEQWNKEQE
jgi:acyl-CoA synthetase (AMP-forming)/AMP-acid ligase II